MATTLRADWVVPMAGPPIRGGEVVIADGRIVSVGGSPDPSIRPSANPSPGAGVAILPGLVNPHTHLKLTGFDGMVEETDFAAWIPHVTRLIGARSPEEFRAATRQGVRDCWAQGVTTVADCGTSGAVIEALHDLGGSGIAYHEIFGPDPATAGRQLEGWMARMRELERFATPRVRLGASPHAPYTVSGQLYRMTAAQARREGWPLALHIAEADDEVALLRDGSGGFAEGWRRRGIPVEAPGCSPVQWLDRHEVFGPDALAIHVIAVDAADIATLAQRGCGVAHCPRSNRRHHRRDAPLRELLGALDRVGVGTDSVASVAPLDLLAEARAARALAGLTAEAALHLVTLGAARAIRLEAEVGSLEAGKWGDAVAIRIPEGTAADRLYEAILATGPAEVLGTWIGGRQVVGEKGLLV